jgi:methylthioribose-1-phosphate isomerase
VQWQAIICDCSISACCHREERWIDCRDAGQVTQAIRDLVVRGAPAIGIAAAWGVAWQRSRAIAR